MNDARDTIAILEDDPADQKLLELGLRGLSNIQVLFYATAEEALLALPDVSPDLLLVDINLPGMNGLDFASQIKERNIPLIVISGAQDDDAMLHGYAQGAIDFLIKPVLPRILKTKVRLYLNLYKRELTRSLADAVLVTDDAYQICYANPAALRLFGRPGSDLLGTMVLPPLDSKARIQILQPSGALRHVSIHTLPTTWDGKPATIISLHDVTEDTETQRTARHLAETRHLSSLGNIMGGIAHELNNPATRIALNLHHIQTTIHKVDTLVPTLRQVDKASQLDLTTIPLMLDEVQERVEESLRSIEQLSHLLQDLKLFTLIEANTREVTAINDVARACSHLARRLLPTEVTLQTSLGAPPDVLAHPNKLSQTLLGLILRVARLCPEEQPAQLQLSTYAQRGRAVICLQTPSASLSEAELKRLFSPFTNKGRQNIGHLGLTLIAESVALLNGDLNAQSDERDGLTIALELDGCPDELLTHFDAARREAPQPTHEAPDRPTALLIDDDPIIRASLKRTLKAWYDVTSASDGLKALAVLDVEESFDVILCDLMMPNMDGATFYKRLKAQRPELCSRVTFVTGGAYTTEVREFVERSNVPVLEKPFTVDELKSALNLT